MNSEIEHKVNDALEEAYDNHERSNERRINYVLKEIDRTRLELIDLLTEYAKQDNTISKARINTLLDELDEIERQIRQNGLKALDEVIEDSASSAIESAYIALGIVGVLALSSRKERRLARGVVDYVFGRFSEKDLPGLDTRMNNLAIDYGTELSRVLRKGVITGKSVNDIVKEIKSVYESEAWKIRRIVITEANTAHRTGIARAAEESDVVKAIKIIDHPGHRNHTKHRCYELARQNPYGWGEGIYRPQDTYIYSPHPRCRASFRYVLKDEYLTGGES